jgi:hypothetical protein
MLHHSWPIALQSALEAGPAVTSLHSVFPCHVHTALGVLCASVTTDPLTVLLQGCWQLSRSPYVCCSSRSSTVAPSTAASSGRPCVCSHPSNCARGTAPMLELRVRQQQPAGTSTHAL